MAVTKTINVDGIDVVFKASAAVPRIYRAKFGRDIYTDISALQESLIKSDEAASTLDTFSLELFEDMAWVMARHADPDVPETPEEWLDQFNVFSIYEVLPQILELWGMNTQTTVESKKNRSVPKGK